ncbi:unnamed protein product [Bathycoccus prasinos]
MFWLNAEASENIPYISLALCSNSQCLEASENIPYIVVTFSVFQSPMSWLNAEAEENIDLIDVADAVFHFEMLPMN